MIQVLIRFLTFNVVSDHPAVYWALAAVWFLLLLAALSSIRSLPVSFGAKVVWFLIIVVLPLVGLAAYAFRCLIRGNWSFLKPIFSPPQSARKIAPR